MKLLAFFQWLKDKVTAMLIQAWNTEGEYSEPDLSYAELVAEYREAANDPDSLIPPEESDKETLELLVQVSVDGEVIDVPIPQWVVGDEVRHTDGKSSLVIGMLFNLETQMWQYTLALVDSTTTDAAFSLKEDLN